MSEQDVKRYLEFEVPGIGMVENDVSEVVCFNSDCNERVTVDPATLVPEDDEAVDVESRELGSNTRYQVEIYCSTSCRNDHYAEPVDDEEAKEVLEKCTDTEGEVANRD